LAVSLAFSGVSKVKAGAAIAKGAYVQTNASGKAITAAVAANAASKDGSVGPFNMSPGDTEVIDVDNAGNATATFDAAAGTQVSNNSWPVADQSGLTDSIVVDGGAAVEVTYPAGTTTAAHVAAAIGAQVPGLSAVAATHVTLTSDSKGTGSTIAVTPGSAATTWDAATAGTGDVVDISAVTPTEYKTVIEADTTAEVTVNPDGSTTITSPTTGSTSELDFISGNVLAIVGHSVETLTGSASGAYHAGKALEAASADGDLIAVLLKSGLNV